MKKVSKVIAFLMVVLMVISTMSTVFAAPDPSKYDGSGANVNTSGIEGLGQNIITIITTVGSIASVVVLVVLGIKYMMGSAEEKAEYKKTMLPYVIGAILTFGITNILAIVIDMTKVFTN